MKRLWKYIPPCLSDVQGFQAVVKETDGMGIVDDPSRYKFIPSAAQQESESGGRPEHRGGPEFGNRPGYGSRPEHGDMPGHGSRPEFGGGPEFGSRPGYGSRPEHEDMSGHGSRPEFGGRPEHGGRPGPGDGAGHGGRPEHGGRPGFCRHGGAGSTRVVQSDLRNEDIINGTEKKLMSAYENNKNALNPEFVLLCNAPSSSMISSDLDSAAERIRQDGIPAAAVNIHGDKDYLYGVKETLKVLGELILEKSETHQPCSVNILGCNIIDWSAENLEALKELLEAAGWYVLTCWGAAGSKVIELKCASQASVNLVVNVSGLALARWMEQEFEIPYVISSACGSEECAEMLFKLKESAETGRTLPAAAGADAGGEADAVIIGEQIFANAVRRVLRGRGYENVRVYSLYEMDKSCMAPGDKKLSGEDEIKKLTSGENIKLIAADPDVRPAAGKDTAWINLPNSGMSVVDAVPPLMLAAGELDRYIDKGLEL